MMVRLAVLSGLMDGAADAHEHKKRNKVELR